MHSQIAHAGVVALVSCVPGAGASFLVLAAIIVGGLVVATALSGVGSYRLGRDWGLAPLTPLHGGGPPLWCWWSLKPPLCPWVSVMVHVAVHLGDTGWSIDLVGRFSCVGSV